MTYFVLAGGFWSQSKYSDICSRQVDPKAPGMAKSMDYVIGIEGLPEDYVQPEGEIENLTYWCTQCNKPVPQNHVEMNYGCQLNHKVETKAIKKENWRTDVFEKYSIKTAPWIKGYRVWMNNNNGIEKWKEIFSVIDNHCRSKGIPTPMPVRISSDGHAIETPDKIPTVKLDIKKEVKEPVEEKKEKSIQEDVKCEICGKVCKSAFGLSVHKRHNHKENQDVGSTSNDNANANA